jgi:glycosyltransferase involved in cell wall biosynthesis
MTFFIAAIHGKGSLFRYFHALGTELASRGHRVVIIVSQRTRDEAGGESNPAVLTWPSPVPKTFRDAKFLNSLITRYKPDCIIGNFSTIVICTLIGWLRRVPVRMAWTHTMIGAIEMDSPVPRWKRVLMTRRRQFVYSFATQVIANSRAMSEDIQRAYHVPPHKIEIVYPLLPEPLYDQARRRGNMILYVGRLATSKGLDVLLRALPRIVKSFPDIVVEFLGDGPARQEYESMAESLGVGSECRFLGAVPSETVYERMSSAALQVSPSLHEALGLVNVEAHSVGTPVVASNTGGIGEVVIDGETGFLFPPGDPVSLEEKIIRLLRDDRLRDRMGKAARAHFERTFSFRLIPEQADYFERLANS